MSTDGKSGGTADAGVDLEAVEARAICRGGCDEEECLSRRICAALTPKEPNP